MRIHLIAVGVRMPLWVQQGYQQYAQRMTQDCQLNLVEIPLAKRTKKSLVEKAMNEEGDRILQAIPARAQVVALEVDGKSWDTPRLSRQLQDWSMLGTDVALLVGGPDGLSEACRQKANLQWSLSALTFPHPIVRIMVAEQLYRAWSIVKGHPYHRE